MLSEFQRDDAIIWFIHNKGVSRDEIEFSNIADWRRMMMYFLFEKEWCVTALSADFYDTCGSNLQFDPVTHYSGTFGMAHSRYIKTLPYASNFWHVSRWGDRYAGEFWLLHSSINFTRALCLFSSKVNHYTSPYPRFLYADVTNIGHGCPYGVKPGYLEFLSKRVHGSVTSSSHLPPSPLSSSSLQVLVCASTPLCISIAVNMSLFFKELSWNKSSIESSNCTSYSNSQPSKYSWLPNGDHSFETWRLPCASWTGLNACCLPE